MSTVITNSKQPTCINSHDGIYCALSEQIISKCKVKVVTYC